MSGRRALPALASIVAGVLVWLAFVVPVLAASPSPTGGTGGDPRSSGQGPGLVGDPGLAVLVVIGIALAAAGLTLGYIRITARRPR